MNSCLENIYNELNSAEKYLLSEKHNIDITITVLNKNVDNLPDSIMDESHFFPDKFRHKIVRDGQYLLSSTYVINDREFMVNIVICDELEVYDIEKMFHTIFLWLYVVSKYAESKCSKRLNIDIYMNDIPKEIPIDRNEILGPKYVNSAYTYSCRQDNNIVIFREEEWVKVFIHETFHAFGLDSCFSSEFHKIQEQLHRIYNIDDKYSILLSEVYSEVWSRVIHIMIGVFIERENDSSQTKYRDICKKELEKESLHSMMVATKVLKYMGISYPLLITTDSKMKSCVKRLYKESSNILCYYVITSLIMCYIDEFIELCHKINKNCLLVQKKTGSF